MSQWKSDDSAANSVLWGVAGYKQPANTTTQAEFYGNTTVDSYHTGMRIGQFAVDSTEIAVATGNLIFADVITGGSGYAANAVVTLTLSDGTTNATAVSAVANVTAGVGGFIESLSIDDPGDGSYAAGIAGVSIAAPAAVNITANSSGFSNTTDVILVATANSKWQAGDSLYYGVPAANTPIEPLTGNTWYYVAFANTTAVALTSTLGGANIDITDARTSDPGETHTFTGQTATGSVTISSGKHHGVAHAGWVVRKEGTGGRAGRVQYETLVACRITSDGSDDTVLPE